MAALISYNNSLRLVVNSSMSPIIKWYQISEFVSCDWFTQEYEEQVIQTLKTKQRLQWVGKYNILLDKIALLHINSRKIKLCG